MSDFTDRDDRDPDDTPVDWTVLLGAAVGLGLTIFVVVA